MTKHPTHRPTRPSRGASAITATLLALTVTACGSDSDSDAATDTATDATADSVADPVADPVAEAETDGAETDGAETSDSEPASGDPASGLPLVAVGETVTINAVGAFDATYLGLGDLGAVTTLQGDEIQCLAILGEVTLVAEGEIPGASLSPQRADALDASGAVIDVNASAECLQSPLSEAGYADAFGVQWEEGVAQTIRFDVVAVPTDAMGQLDRIQITPSTPEFEFEATVTETL